MFSPGQTYPSDDNDRERLARAREAAEALFTARPAANGSAPAHDESEPAVRKPRVLSVVRPVAAPPQPPPEPIRRRPRQPRPRVGIPPAQHARVRTWVEYGMTAAEVAQVYGTEVGEIERILRKA